MKDYKDQVSDEAITQESAQFAALMDRAIFAAGMTRMRSILLPIIEEKEKELNVTDYLLESQHRVINAIPECELHGNRCIPNAVEWINKQLANQKDAIGFAEWIAGCMYERIIDKVGEEYKAVGWSCGDDEILTTQELYELYLKQKA